MHLISSNSWSINPELSPRLQLFLFYDVWQASPEVRCHMTHRKTLFFNLTLPRLVSFVYSQAAAQISRQKRSLELLNCCLSETTSLEPLAPRALSCEGSTLLYASAPRSSPPNDTSAQRLNCWDMWARLKLGSFIGQQKTSENERQTPIGWLHSEVVALYLTLFFAISWKIHCDEVVRTGVASNISFEIT